MRIDKVQQLVIERSKDIRLQMAACLRERTGGSQARSSGQQGKERIEFDLHRAAGAGEQKSDQRLKRQIALACEIPGIPAGGFEKGLALNEGGEAIKYVFIFRPSYLTYTYQYDKDCILTHEPARLSSIFNMMEC